MKEKNSLIILLFFFIVLACNDQSNEQGKIIASVVDEHLYYSDIEHLLPENYTVEDSANLIRSYLDGWAKKKLLLKKAELNLSKKKISDFDQQIKNYREDLLINRYKQHIIAEKIDTSISSEEMKKYYEKYKQTFTLNEPLAQLVYVVLPKGSDKINDLSRQFRHLNKKKDNQAFYDLVFQSTTDHLLNDSIWVRMDDVLKKIPPLAKVSKGNLVNRVLKLEDSISVYLVRVKQLKHRKEIAPIEYASPIISKLILNKRRLEFIRKMETELLNNAIQNKTYVIHEK